MLCLFTAGQELLVELHTGNRPLLKPGNETLIETIQEEFLWKKIAIESGVSLGG